MTYTDEMFFLGFPNQTIETFIKPELYFVKGLGC